MDIPRSIVIRESGSRILNPIDEHKQRALGHSLHLPAGSTVLDLACGKGELLCTWARDLGFAGTGVDLSSAFIQDARNRAEQLAVGKQLRFVHDDATGWVADHPVDVAACLGGSWIGGEKWHGRVEGTLALLERSIRPGGLLLLGEPFWRHQPTDQDTVEGCYAQSVDDFVSLTGLTDRFDALGYDLVETVFADPDSWDRYAAPQWLATRRWLDTHPDDELAAEMRADLRRSPQRHLRYQREYLGWGVFVLIRR